MRHLDRDAGIQVAKIFLRQRGGIIFDVVEHVETVALLLMHKAKTYFVGFHQDFQIGPLLDISTAHLGPA